MELRRKLQTWLTNAALSIPVNTEAAILDLISSFDLAVWVLVVKTHVAFRSVIVNWTEPIWNREKKDSAWTHININIILLSSYYNYYIFI